MRFEYDPALVEQATFLAARAGAEHECALHQLLDPLYGIPDVELRLRGFRAAYADMFRRMGLDRIVPAYTRLFPRIGNRLTRCLVRQAERLRAQSVDLYHDKTVQGATAAVPTLIIALCPEFFLDPAQLRPWMYRQLLHVDDMLDDEFAYHRALPEVSATERNLIRDRYGVLWDMYVEGRLVRSGLIDRREAERLWPSLVRLLTHNGQRPSRKHFERLLNARALKHEHLLSWAVAPAKFLSHEGDNEYDGLRGTESRAVCGHTRA